MAFTVSKHETVTVNAKEVRIHMKVRDEFSCRLVDEHGVTIAEQDEGYVPSFMPGEHYGDYVILNIDLETGQVTNWRCPDRKDIQQWIDSKSVED